MHLAFAAAAVVFGMLECCAGVLRWSEPVQCSAVACFWKWCLLLQQAGTMNNVQAAAVRAAVDLYTRRQGTAQLRRLSG